MYPICKVFYTPCTYCKCSGGESFELGQCVLVPRFCDFRRVFKNISFLRGFSKHFFNGSITINLKVTPCGKCHLIVNTENHIEIQVGESIM